MTTFDERGKAFERKFALDQNLQFKSEARRNRKLAEWAGSKLGIGSDGMEAYTKEVLRSDLKAAGDGDVFAKIRADFDAKGVAVSDLELREKMDEFLIEAAEEIEAAGKS